MLFDFHAVFLLQQIWVLTAYGPDKGFDIFIHAAVIREGFLVRYIGTVTYPEGKVLLIKENESLIGAFGK